MDDPDFLQAFTRFFLYNYSPYRSIFEFKTKGEYIDYIKNFDIRSLKGDRVKSYAECNIANFLDVTTSRD